MSLCNTIHPTVAKTARILDNLSAACEVGDGFMESFILNHCLIIIFFFEEIIHMDTDL